MNECSLERVSSLVWLFIKWFGKFSFPTSIIDCFIFQNYSSNQGTVLLLSLISCLFFLKSYTCNIGFLLMNFCSDWMLSWLFLLSCHDGTFCRWNVSAGAARPNPQGSFRYGQITVTDVYVILNRPPELIDGKWRTTLNGISYLPPATPLKLAQQFNIPGIYKLDFPNRLMNRPSKFDTSLINGTYRGFMEIIFQNNDTTVQSYHMDGYAFFVVGWAFSFGFIIWWFLVWQNFENGFEQFPVVTVVWISECGQTIAEPHITNGMVLLAALYRYACCLILH